MDKLDSFIKEEVISIEKFTRKEFRYFIAVSNVRSAFELMKDGLEYVSKVIGFGFNRVEELERLDLKELKERLRYLPLLSNNENLLQDYSINENIKFLTIAIELDNVKRRANINRINLKPSGEILVRMLEVIYKIKDFNEQKKSRDSEELVKELNRQMENKKLVEEEALSKNNYKETAEKPKLIIRLITKNVEYLIKENIDPDYVNKEKLAEILNDRLSKIGDTYFITCLDSDNEEVSIPLSSVVKYKRIK